MKIDPEAKWLVMVQFDEWAVVCQCATREEAEEELTCRQFRSFWPHKIVSVEEV